MADENDDVIVDLEALETKTDGEPKVEGEPTKKPEKKQGPTPEEGLAKIQRDLDREKAARVQAERERDEAAQAALKSETESQDNRLHLVNQGIASFNTQNDILEGRLAEAHAAQDYAAVAKIQREMSSNSVKLDRLEVGKRNMEAAPKPELPKREAKVSDDPVERTARQMENENSPRSAKLIRENPEYITDPSKNEDLMAAHYGALSKKLKPDSPAYIASIRADLGLDGGERTRSNDTGIPEGDDSALSEASSPSTGRNASPASAPVTRSGNGTGKRPEQITLTKDEVEMARNSGMSNKEWAEQKLKIKREKEGLH